MNLKRTLKIIGIIVISLVVLYFLIVLVGRFFYVTEMGNNIRKNFCYRNNGEWMVTTFGDTSYGYSCVYNLKIKK